MKFMSYEVDGRASYGTLVDGQIFDIGLVVDADCKSLRAAIAKGVLGDLSERAQHEGRRLSMEQIKLLPVIADPAKIACAGINYRSHASETGRAVPEKPSIFIRLVDTLIAHGDPILLPKISTKLDFEGELAVVIGRSGRYIPEDEALSYVAGYACFNDGSVRDYQKHSVTAGKNFPATGALGPCLVTVDEIADPTALTLTTRVNGVTMQQAGTDEMIHSIPSLIAFVSNFTALGPGDVIATGTPEGVGHRRDPQLWLVPGDVVEVEISSVGLLRNSVEAEA